MSDRVLHIDWTRCRGRGLCIELLEGRLTADPWGFPLAAGSGSDVVVPPAMVAAAEESVALCPVAALTLSRSGNERR